ncbi:unnamed protein product [Ectocarpus sp. 4 AP-2014]
MSAMCTPSRCATPSRQGLTPLRPVTPMGVDLPEDTPSKIRARGAADCASIRRRQQEETAKAELETGRDLHQQMKDDRERRSAHAKGDTALRRDLLARQATHKKGTLEIEAERERESKAREKADQRASDALKELRRQELEAEKREARQSRVEAILHSKAAKDSEQARERSLVKKDYEAGLAERRLKEEEAKAARKAEAEARKTAMLEARDLKIKERALAASLLRAEIEHSREKAKAKEVEEKKAADDHRQALRARAGQYRQDKELAKTSAFAR